MTVTLISHTPQPEQIIAAAAKLCYSDTTVEDLMDGLSAEQAEKFVGMLETMGHESPVEHVTFTFGIAGVSRSLLAQITRHRIASFSVQSQRYVRKNQFTYVTPPAIAADEAAAALYHQTMEQTVQAYNALADRLQATYYPQFLAEGCTEKAARSKAEKKAIEDARYVLPLSLIHI